MQRIQACSEHGIFQAIVICLRMTNQSHDLEKDTLFPLVLIWELLDTSLFLRHGKILRDWILTTKVNTHGAFMMSWALF